MRNLRVRRYRFFCAVVGMLLACCVVRAEPAVHFGERLDPSTYGSGVIESMEEAMARDRAAKLEQGGAADERAARRGEWIVPAQGALFFANSGERYVTNKWGDTSMGIGFPEPVDVRGTFIAGQAHEGVWTSGVRALGYRDGK